MTFLDYLQTQNRCLNWRAREGYPPTERLLALVPAAKRGAWAVELGACRGMASARLAAKGYRVLGLELFYQLVREAVPGPRIGYVVADMHDAPCRDGGAVIVFADNVLEHAHDIRGILVEVARVLAPGGCLYGAIPLVARVWSECHLWSVNTPEELVALFQAIAPTLRLRTLELVEADEPQCLFVLENAA
mgnify:CR=1 FL=1